jgi:hypothetical protein
MLPSAHSIRRKGLGEAVIVSYEKTRVVKQVQDKKQADLVIVCYCSRMTMDEENENNKKVAANLE